MGELLNATTIGDVLGETVISIITNEILITKGIRLKKVIMFKFRLFEITLNKAQLITLKTS